MWRSRFRLSAGVLVFLLAVTAAAAQTKLLRFPDIHGNRIVFTYAGDLWSAPVEGGTAVRLTSHPGLELFARFSPDGKWIAFTGQYDGDEQVYVMPAGGGVPKQLTFYPARGPLPPRWGYDNQVYGWTPDGSRILFRSLRDSYGLTDSRLYTVSPKGGLPEALPLPYAGCADLSPDGRRVVYSPLVRDFRTWKRYEGGWAQELYIFDLDTYEIERITRHPRSDRDPMWIGNAIYFTSDRSGKNNIYRFDLETREIEPITRFETWDVRWPATDGERRIVFELNGELHVLDVETREEHKVPITVPHDGVWMRPGYVDASRNIEDYSLSPKGRRVLFVARGEVLSTPVEHGRTIDLTRSPGAHDRSARYSPDGKRVAFISDRDGEDQLYVMPASGEGHPVKLTEEHRAYLEGIVWSPDGKRIAYHDQAGRLYVYEFDSHRVRLVADDPQPFGLDPDWSPDGRFLAYSLGETNDRRSLFIWEAETGRTHRVTSRLFNERNPVWGPEGKYLFFLADRDFAPQLGSIEWNYVLDRETGVFALALAKDTPSPVPPRIDEVESALPPEEEEKAGAADKKKKEGEKKGLPEVRVDFDGLADRVVRIPIEAGNIDGLSAVEGGLLYVTSGADYYGRETDVPPTLEYFDLEKRKASKLLSGVKGYALSADRRKVLVRDDSGFHVFDADPNGPEKAKDVSTSGLKVWRVPALEWRQIFNEVWRRYRDFFYVENMHGYDWEALREQYRPWLDHVAHRSDLNYVIGEMIAELNVGHAYVAGGDLGLPQRPSVALPGARFALDAEAGRYRIVKIFRGQNEEPKYRSPLTEVGVDVREGDYVLAIDGEELTADENPYRVLRNRAGGPVVLTVNEKPTFEGARKAVYRPIRSEASLIYLEWVTRNRERVAELSGGRVGYLHLPDMGASGIQEFIKWYYPQLDKDGLVIDVRGNGGGNVSQMIIDRLSRKLLMIDYERNRDYWDPYPTGVFPGRLVCLIDEDTASDGDQFAYVFRAAGLGPLIGKRTWGGVVGIYGRAPLMDGGTIYVPEAGTADAEGHWVIEGHGVDPDIEVENDPKSLIEGRDPQLERAVQEVMRAIEAHPVVRPPRPEAPVKTP